MSSRLARGTVRRGAPWASALEVAAVLGKAYSVAEVCVAPRTAARTTRA